LAENDLIEINSNVGAAVSIKSVNLGTKERIKAGTTDYECGHLQIGLLNPFIIKQFLNEVSRVVRSDGKVILFDSKYERFQGAYKCDEFAIQYRDAKTFFVSDHRVAIFKKSATYG
jgi:hypothetical protein